MAWGTSKRGVDDIERRIRHDAASFRTIYILPQRKFDENAAERIADALESNVHLREFYASGHAVGSRGATAFAKMLERNKTLERLCIGSSTFGDDAAVELCRGIARNQGLKCVDLSNRSLTDVAASALRDALIYNKKCTIRDLQLSRNRLRCVGSARVFEGLSAVTGLSATPMRLDLSENEIDASKDPQDAMACAMNSFLRHPKCTLHYLRMTRNISIPSLISGLSSNASLTRLELGHVNMDNETFLSLLRTICEHPSLSHLDVSDNLITLRNIQSILTRRMASEGSKQPLGNESEDGKNRSSNVSDRTKSMRCPLVSLILAGNDLGERVRDFVDARAKHDALRSLREVDVSRCNVGTESIDSLLQMRGVRDLNVSQNALSDDGCMAVARLLHDQSTSSDVETLHMCNNGITSRGAKVLCDTIARFDQEERATFLSRLVIGGNAIGRVGRESAQHANESQRSCRIVFDTKPSGESEEEDRDEVGDSGGSEAV